MRVPQSARAHGDERPKTGTWDSPGHLMVHGTDPSVHALTNEEKEMNDQHARASARQVHEVDLESLKCPASEDDVPVLVRWDAHETWERPLRWGYLHEEAARRVARATPHDQCPELWLGEDEKRTLVLGPGAEPGSFEIGRDLSPQTRWKAVQMLVRMARLQVRCQVERKSLPPDYEERADDPNRPILIGVHVHHGIANKALAGPGTEGREVRVRVFDHDTQMYDDKELKVLPDGSRATVDELDAKPATGSTNAKWWW